ncbi:Myb-like DNA-binding domain protein [Datura stramonium]|uniref:Myb-like DNA-binding domain protein n=1 Tax=Datura stramonium TaxID=4076 RepID=A0ABS8RYS0_DATST|nr:Myb-like DNA-binding domain protein [Datura stramonium]
MIFDDDEEFSGSDSDDGFQEDMEALKKACLLFGKDADDLQPSSSIGDGHVAGADNVTPSVSDADDDDDDIQLVRSIQERFALSAELREPLSLKPLCSFRPPGSEGDEDDDFETLRAIQRRFAAYDDDSGNGREESPLDKFEQVGVTNITSEKETSNNFFLERTNAEEGFPACVDGTIQISEGCSNDVAGSHNLTKGHDSGAETTAVSVNSSCFPKSAQAFVDAIKKNRSCQKVIRDKMLQIEARLEELKKLKERVKILKGFQLTCRKRMGRALSQKRDARVQLISLPKQRFSAKLQGKKLSAINCGPPENSHVASFREALTHFAVSLSRKEWSKEESENLAKGVKQQFQEMLLQRSVNLLSDGDGCSRESGDLDGLIGSIRDHVITPETMRLFLPKVNWDQVASMYLSGRSGAECQSRWINWEDPLIKHEGWDLSEEKNLLHAVQQKGMINWVDIAASLGVCRTPFQCLSHYQRSLNASIIRREWTDEEDIRLCAAVETFGESNWQFVASVIEGRTGTQCSNRWIKSLHPALKRCGKWSADEDKRLKVAVMLFHPKSWRNISQSVPGRAPIWKQVAQYVPGRTHVQCRERWVNSLDPSLKLDEWTKEEDLKLKSAIDEHGYSWSKVAACVPPRTDNQCRRRWVVLCPDEVPMLQEAKKIRREAFISNFVDREEERPALRPNDIVPTPKLSYRAGCQTASANKKRKLRPRAARDDTAPRCDAICEVEKRHSEGSEGPESSDLINNSLLSSRDQEIQRILEGEEAFEQGCHDAVKNKRQSKLHRRKTKKFTPNDKIPEASASSTVESTIVDGNICRRRRRRTSSLVKRESRAIASQGSSSSLANLSSSMTVVEEAESLVQDSKKAKNIKKDKRHSTSEYDPCIISPQGPPLGTADLDVGENVNVSAIPGTLEGENSGASGSHKLNNKCNQLKNSDRSSIDDLPETTDDCMTLASFICKSRARRCSSSSTKVSRLHPDKAQSKAMAGAHPGRSCVSGGHNGMEKRTTQECNEISGAEVEDDAPLSFLMRRVRPRQH